MKKTENVYITHVLFPWETFAAQSEREARERAAEFMNTSMRNSCLNDVYRLVPLHFREEVFAGVSFPIWNQGARG